MRLHRLPLHLYKFENGEEERSYGNGSPNRFKDAKAQSKRRLMSQKSSEEDEDDQESEEAEEGSPSNSEIEKSASQSKRTAELRKQLEAEERTQKQLEERIADLKRKNKKSNAAFAQLQDSQFNGDGDNEEVHTPKNKSSAENDPCWMIMMKTRR